MASIRLNLHCPTCGNVVRCVSVNEGSTSIHTVAGVCTKCKQKYRINYNCYGE